MIQLGNAILILCKNPILQTQHRFCTQYHLNSMSTSQNEYLHNVLHVLYKLLRGQNIILRQLPSKDSEWLKKRICMVLFPPQNACVQGCTTTTTIPSYTVWYSLQPLEELVHQCITSRVYTQPLGVILDALCCTVITANLYHFQMKWDVFTFLQTK